MFTATSLLAAGDTSDFTIPTAPTVDAGGAYAGDWNTPIQLNATVVQNSGSDLVMNWTSDSDGTFSNANIEDPTFTPSTTGAIVLTLTVTTSNTNVITDTASLTSNVVAPIVDAGGAYSGTVSLPVTTNATVTNGSDNSPTYKWSSSIAGSFSNITGKNTNFTPSATGSYTLTLTVTTIDSSDVLDTANSTSSTPVSLFQTYDSSNNSTTLPQGIISTGDNSPNVWQVADKNFGTSFDYNQATNTHITINTDQSIWTTPVTKVWVFGSTGGATWRASASDTGASFSFVTTGALNANVWNIIDVSAWSTIYNIWRFDFVNGSGGTIIEVGVGNF